jgi:hypothetical protein
MVFAAVVEREREEERHAEHPVDQNRVTQDDEGDIGEKGV